MNSLDMNYLLLQFRVRIHSMIGIEFQSFFEDVMEKAYPDFQKIRPYGFKGDGGNDGYRPYSGIYYQIYAPATPKVNESEAAKKLRRDFQRLQAEWDEISNIKVYVFVFNDKYGGSVQSLESSLSDLKEKNPNIEFKLLLSKDLEKIFLELQESEMLSLKFDVDQRNSITIAKNFLELLNLEHDKGYVISARHILLGLKEIIRTLDDDNLSLEFNILECKCKQMLEEIVEAKACYESISKRFPSDSRALLYLAEIYLLEKDYEKNLELLKKAEKIDPSNWLLTIEQLYRKIYLREKIDKESLEAISIPEEPSVKSDYYRLFGLIFETLGDLQNADKYVEKSIHLNPSRLANHLAKLTLIHNRLIQNPDSYQRQILAKELVDEIYKVENELFIIGDLGAKHKVILNTYKLTAYLAQEDIIEFERISKETFPLLLTCYFNAEIEHAFVFLLSFVSLPINELNELLGYLKISKMMFSDEFTQALFFQFDLKSSLFTDGKKFFKEFQNRKYYEFICDLENKKIEDVLLFIKNDIRFSLVLTNTLKYSPDLRKLIIDNLPNDMLKEKLSLLLNFDEKDFDEAFQLIKQLDLSKLTYLECGPILQIIQHKQAWDFEVIILKKLVEKEKNEIQVSNLNLQLFNALQNLNKFTEVIALGEQILDQDSVENLLSPINREILLTDTLIACFERGKVDGVAFKKAKELLLKYRLEKPSFQFRIGVEAEVFLNNNEIEKAVESIIEGLKAKKSCFPEDYAKLYFLLIVRIGNQIDLNLISSDSVQENNFVKICNKDRWYYIGHDNELDAYLITKENDKFYSFLNKKPGDKILFKSKYGKKTTEEEIELIFSIKKYIFWQCIHSFQELAEEGTIEGVQTVELPQEKDVLDLGYLLEFLEDQHKKTASLFDLYCQNNIPLAILAYSEGSLTNAVGRIQQENRGYVNFSDGSLAELEKQIIVAQRVFEDNVNFYIDGTSALFLSEIGLMKKILNILPNIMVPQSVINMLADVAAKIRYSPERLGYLGYARGRLMVSTVSKEKQDLIHSNFIESIKSLESNPKNIVVISSANKMDYFSERNIPEELCDACIMAQKEHLPILTEDFLYLQMNEIETKKKSPDYFSSFILIRLLYESGKIDFTEYLDFFNYLSLSRCRFLTINSIDIEKAIFGDGKIDAVKPSEIWKLNFPLTLSEEYGVSLQNSITVVGLFLLKVLMDETVTSEIAEKIFIEILESFPTNLRKKEFGKMLLKICYEAMRSEKPGLILIPKNSIVHTKLKKLLLTTEIYDSE